jgi:hypothetical protein
MKTIITLLVAAGLVGSTFAQQDANTWNLQDIYPG